MKILPAALTTAAVGALLMVGAAPAAAAGNQIDEGDKLYSINCDDEVYNDWQLLSVDPPTAVSTTIGDGDGGVSEDYFACAYQPAYNPATGVSYYIQRQISDGSEYLLATIDVTTGVSTTIGEFYYWNNEFQQYPSVDSMAIGLDGSAYAIAEGYLWSIDLNDGELTRIGFSLVSTYAFSVDPVSGEFYAIDTANQVFNVDITTGSYTFLGVVSVGREIIFSLQIDGASRFWIMAEEELDGSDLAHLWSFDLPTYTTPVYSGIFDDDPYFTEALLLIPAKVLPATGPAESGAAAVAGLALLSLGGALIVTRRIRSAR